MKRLIRIFLVSGTVAMLHACASGPVNTETPTTGNLIFQHDQLQAYLDQRRAYLGSLKTKLSDIDTELIFQLGQLKSAKDALSTAKQDTAESEAAAAQASAEVERLQWEAEQTLQSVLQAEATRNALQEQVDEVANNPKADEEQIRDLQSRVGQLEQQVGGLDRAIQRTLDSRQNQILRSE